MFHTGYKISIGLIMLIIIFLNLLFTNKFCDRYSLLPIDLCFKSSYGEKCAAEQEKAVRFACDGGCGKRGQ